MAGKKSNHKNVYNKKEKELLRIYERQKQLHK